MAERTVEQRLRLGNVSPMILQAYRDGDTNLDTLMAFALTTDRKLQEEVWNNLRETRSYVGEHNVRAILLEDSIRGSSRIAEFVGIDEYEKAGGRVTRDLFAAEDSHGIWLEDPQILLRPRRPQAGGNRGRTQRVMEVGGVRAGIRMGGRGQVQQGLPGQGRADARRRR